MEDNGVLDVNADDEKFMYEQQAKTDERATKAAAIVDIRRDGWRTRLETLIDLTLSNSPTNIVAASIILSALVERIAREPSVTDTRKADSRLLVATSLVNSLVGTAKTGALETHPVRHVLPDSSTPPGYIVNQPNPSHDTG